MYYLDNSEICNSHMQGFHCLEVQFDILESTPMYHASSKVYNYDKHSK